MMTPLTLRDARARWRLTQQQLAAAAGLSRVTVSNIERGRTRPGPRAARRLSAVLGLPPRAIVEFQLTAEAPRLRPPAILAAPAPPVLRPVPAPERSRRLFVILDGPTALRARSAEPQEPAALGATVTALRAPRSVRSS